jgi:hypothetical protein
MSIIYFKPRDRFDSANDTQILAMPLHGAGHIF